MTLTCLNCGEETEYYDLCSNCVPFLYKKGSYPHQKIRKTKQ